MTQDQQSAMKLMYHLPPGMCDDLGELLCHTLLGSSYRFGELRWGRNVEEGALPEGIRPICGRSSGESMGVIIHKSRGLLLLGSYELPSAADSRQDLRAGITTTHRGLLEAQRRLRRRIDEALPGVQSHPLVGIAVVIREFLRPGDIGADLPEEIVIEESDLSVLESRLDEIFDFFSSDGATATMIPSLQMRKAVKEAIWPDGRLCEERVLVGRYNKRYQLYPPIPPAA